MKSVLLIISGSVAAYKSLELIRLLKSENVTYRVILTGGGEKFITPMAVSSISGEETYTDLFSLKDETEMGHIRLSRESSLIVIAPASANMISKIANGNADDLASTVVLAANVPVMIAPAMNPMMWNHPATKRNIEIIKKDGVKIIGPASGDMACGENGSGRMIEPVEIKNEIMAILQRNDSLKGMHAIVTAGSTQEPLDDVRYLGNRSSGKQGYAIAASLAAMGAKVTLISGAASISAPAGVEVIKAETAAAMFEACDKSLPADIFVAAAAVADWAPVATSGKIKKQDGASPPVINLRETQDILKHIAEHKKRPALVVGFAAESDKSEKNMLETAELKRQRKKADWLVANEIKGGRIFGSEMTDAWLLTGSNRPEHFANISKRSLADRIAERIAGHFSNVESIRGRKKI